MGGKEGRRGDERVKTASRGVMENGKGGREGRREREGGRGREERIEGSAYSHNPDCCLASIFHIMTSLQHDIIN